MAARYETSSNDTKSFDWTALAPGEYKMEGNNLIRVDNVSADYSTAADNFVEALRRIEQ